MVLYCLCFIVIYKKTRTFLVFVYLDLQGNNQEHGLGLMRSGEEGDQWRVTTQHASMQNKVYRVKVPTVRGPVCPGSNSPRAQFAQNRYDWCNKLIVGIHLAIYSYWCNAWMPFIHWVAITFLYSPQLPSIDLHMSGCTLPPFPGNHPPPTPPHRYLLCRHQDPSLYSWLHERDIGPVKICFQSLGGSIQDGEGSKGPGWMPSVRGHCKDWSPLWGSHLLQMQSILQVSSFSLFCHKTSYGFWTMKYH